jgi:hypothetical protein
MVLKKGYQQSLLSSSPATSTTTTKHTRICIPAFSLFLAQCHCEKKREKAGMQIRVCFVVVVVDVAGDDESKLCR